MHSFQPSRGRILFEVFCAFGIVASCVGAWKQTGASALLAAASFAGLYGFVRLLDLARNGPVEAVEPQRIEFEPEVQYELPAYGDVVVPMVAAEPRLMTVEPADEVESVEAAAPQAKAASRVKAPRRAGGRRAKAPKEAKVTEIVPPEQAEVAVPLAVEEAEFAAAPPHEEEYESFPEEEAAHPHIAPLFEPAPYVHVRQQRAAFGRKAR